MHSTLHKFTRPISQLGLVLALAIPGTANAEVVFSESFESPVVSGYDDNTLPDNGNWVGTNQGYGATDRGLYNETFAWPDTAVFTTPYGEQAYLLNGPNNGMTTAENATGLVVTEGVEVSVSFNAAILTGATSTDYRVQLVAFDATEDDSKRNDVRAAIAGTVLATAEGTVTTTDLSEAITFSYTPNGADPIGDDLGIRLLKPGGSVLYDNIRIIVGHDFNPAPENEVIVPSGGVNLSWTNRPANTGSDAWVDVWFGTDPLALVKEVDAAQNSTSATVSAPTADVYYWRVDSYLEGAPTGTPVEGDLFKFEVIDSDNDGLPDTYEEDNTTPSSSTALDPSSDLDVDDLTAAQEYFYGTDPNLADTDEDNLEDGDEINGTAGDRPATNPLLADTDADGLNDDVETNTGTWVSSADTGTNPVDPDWDNDGLVDGVETNDDNYLGQSATGSDPYDADSDDDNVLDWYEVTAAFTDPNDASKKPPLPYPLPDPDSSTGATDKPVKVYIMSGQSNMVGFGPIDGTGIDTLENMVKVENKFPNLVDGSGEWTTRQDVRFQAVVSDIEKTQFSPGNSADNKMGPEIGFGFIMGYYHDEPVLLIKSSQGNRSLAWDFATPLNPQWTVPGASEGEGTTYAGYGESPASWDEGTTPTPATGWYAGKQYDDCFLDESEMGRVETWQNGFDYTILDKDNNPVGGYAIKYNGVMYVSTASHIADSNTEPGVGANWETVWAYYEIENVVDILDNFAAEYPDWAAQGFEIAGFVWWQGDKDRYSSAYANKYEENLVNLIDSLRTYYTNRYPGQVAINAPFVLATLGQTVLGDSSNAAEESILNAQLAVDGEAGNYPQYTGNVKTVYSHPLSAGGASNSHYNKNAVTYMMVGDALGNAMVELLETEVPPSPNPMTFEIPPSGTGATEISMVATEATSANGPVEYYFENTTNSDFREWGTDRTWTNTGLTSGQTYSYKVQVRDSNVLAGEFSAEVEGTAEADSTAPAPAPTFESGPTALGEDSITMTATTAVDINGVEYYFECISDDPNDPALDSGWQVSRTYTPTGLAHSTEYTYTVKAKDSLGNVTADSDPASATTDTPDLIAPTPNPMTFNVLPTAQGENSITMTATTASDDSGVKYYFECTSDSSASSQWQTDTTYTATGLTHSTEYTFVVRAKDNSPAENTTGNSAQASATTDAPDLTAPEISTRNPSNGTPGVDINSNLILTFDEFIAAGTGLITIKNLSDSTQSTIDITDDTQITIIDDTLTINPSSALLESKDYAIQIAGSAIDDLVGNSFAGISNDTGWYFTTADPPPPGLVFSEDFQSPNISGYVKKSKPDNGQWVSTSSTSGFGWDNHGLVDADSHASFDAPEFEAGVSQQAYSLDYNGNSGLTTAVDQIGTLQAGITYTVIFDVVRDKGSDGTQDDNAYDVYLAVFDGDADRSDTQGAEKRTILATLTGSDATDTYTQKSFSYTADGTELDSLGGSAVGNDVGLVFVGSGSAAHFDNVEVVTSTSSSTVDHFAISAIGSPQTVGSPITGITVTAEDESDQTVTDFTGTVTFGGTGGFSGTSANFTAGTLSGLSITPSNAGSNLTFTVEDSAGNTGTVTIATIQTAFSGWSSGGNFEDDSNGDGVKDGIAWLLGASGPNDDITELLPTMEMESYPNYATFTYRSNDAAAAHLRTIVQYSNSLGGIWTTAEHNAPNIEIITTQDFYGSGVDKVEVKISKALFPEKLFTRLQTLENR